MITGDGEESERVARPSGADARRVAVTVPVLAGLGDPAAPPVPGPAFLRAPDTTIFVPGDWSVTFTRAGLRDPRARSRA